MRITLNEHDGSGLQVAQDFFNGLAVFLREFLGRLPSCSHNVKGSRDGGRLVPQEPCLVYRPVGCHRHLAKTGSWDFPRHQRLFLSAISLPTPSPTLPVPKVAERIPWCLRANRK